MPKGKTKTRLRTTIGAIYKKPTKGGRFRWYVDFRNAEGKRVRKAARLAQSDQEALVVLQDEIKRAFDREYSIKREQTRIEFKDFAGIYLRNYAQIRKRSWRSDEKYINAQLVPFFGKLQLSDVSPLLVSQFMAKRQHDGMKNSTINRELTVLRRMFVLAQEWNFDVKANPVKKANFFREEEYRRDRVLTEEEESRLFNAAAAHLKPILVCALSTGMRYSEIIGLKWRDVDLVKRQLTVRAESSKSGRERKIPINNALSWELERLRNGEKSAFVFLYPDRKTRKLRPVRTVRRAFENACQRAGIENFHFHDMRHTAATRLLERGADPVSVKDLLGHRSLNTTEIYLHSSLKRMEGAVRLLDRKEDEKRGDLALPGHKFEAKNKAGLFNVFFSVN